MDVYDFDGTLYQGDSTFDFVRFCMKSYPKTLLSLPRTALAALCYMTPFHKDKTRFKDVLYRFLPTVPDVHQAIKDFWKTHESNIAGPCSPKVGDIVISAGPEFLLQDICSARGLKLLASPVDEKAGRVTGHNCSGQEKVRRFYEAYPDETIDAFYSDSKSDTPLAKEAKNAYLVKNGKLNPWPSAWLQ